MIAEEEVAAGRIPAHGDTYFLVDPLDGTKEFVRGGDDYTVNIGLIVTALRTSAQSSPPRPSGSTAELVGEGAWLEDLSGRIPISTRKPGSELVAVASKSHFNQPTADYLCEAAKNCGYVGIGSSLKFCIVAEGRADIYPRLSPTSEWDTAAGHAVLLAAGGRVDGPDGDPLAYGKRAFLNRGFVRHRRLEGGCRSAHSSSPSLEAARFRKASSAGLAASIPSGNAVLGGCRRFLRSRPRSASTSALKSSSWTYSSIACAFRPSTTPMRQASHCAWSIALLNSDSHCARAAPDVALLHPFTRVSPAVRRLCTGRLLPFENCSVSDSKTG